METLQLELDTSTWSSIFDSADDGHQSFSLKEKFDEWKPKILTLIRDYVKVFFVVVVGLTKGEVACEEICEGLRLINSSLT